MRLSIVLFDGFTALDIVGGYEVLANLPGMEVEFIAATQGLITADTRRLALLGYRTFGQTQSTDILYVPGGRGVFKGIHDDELVSTIARLNASSTWTVGICNGVELLGAAGATAHQIRPAPVRRRWCACLRNQRPSGLKR